MKKIAPLAALLSPLIAQAHEGHGLFGPHWHASDTVGFLIAGVLAAAFAWWTHRK